MRATAALSLWMLASPAVSWAAVPLEVDLALGPQFDLPDGLNDAETNGKWKPQEGAALKIPVRIGIGEARVERTR